MHVNLCPDLGTGALRRAATALMGLALCAAAPTAQEDPELAELLAEERAEARRLLRTGDDSAARGLLSELLEDDEADAESRLLWAYARRGRVEPARVVGDLERALDDAEEAGLDGVVREASLALMDLWTEIGEPAKALALVEERLGGVEDDGPADPALAWELAQAWTEAGDRDRARKALRAGARAQRATRTIGPTGLRAGAASALLDIWPAPRSRWCAGLPSRRATTGDVAAVQVELGHLYFEADGEIADERIPEERYPGWRFRRALDACKGHEGALLGLFEIGRLNWRRTSRAPTDYLEEALAARPHSVAGHLAAVSSAMNVGHLPRARQHLETLAELAPARRAVRAEQAALAWVEHRRDDARALLEELVSADAEDGLPERVVGGHLIELYPSRRRCRSCRRPWNATGDDPHGWTLLGRALSNSGDETGGREALEKAVAVAQGRVNAWRQNTLRVLTEVSERYTEYEAGDHTFVWEQAAEAVLATYVVPFYAEAREELAERYGYTPGPVRIEFFGQHAEFSVRSTGYRGFPALGVCFGPVVTAVSPLAELRGTFSWARTAFHEYTHVIHLGLSHNRCPRWITEGLATWEEGRRNPAWMRNMRRDLLDARANGRIFPVRELNGAFRTNRILFAYYQGGLLCRMLVDAHGFAPLVRLLEAFDRGLDLDQATQEVYGISPEELDTRFLLEVDRLLEPLQVEPRWEPKALVARRFAIGSRPPADEFRAGDVGKRLVRRGLGRVANRSEGGRGASAAAPARGWRGTAAGALPARRDGLGGGRRDGSADVPGGGGRRGR